jgi:putative flippase GtrA
MFKQELILKLVRFGTVGLAAAALQFALVGYFSSQLGWGNHLSYWAGYFPALTLHFCLTKWWTFRNKRKKEIWSQLGRYAIASVISAAFQYIIYRFSLRFITAVPQYAAMVGTAAGMVLSFVLMKWGVFEVKTPAQEFPAVR